MEGLRSLATKENTSGDILLSLPSWDVPNNTACVYQVWPRVDESGAVDDLYAEPIEDTALAEFLERGSPSVSSSGPAPDFSSAGVKVAFFGTRVDGPYDIHNVTIHMPKTIFKDLVDKLSPDPLSISMFHRYCTVFEHLGGLADGGIAAAHLRTPYHRLMWSIREHGNSPSFETRCIAIVRHGYQSGASDERCTLLECLEAFKQDVHSPLYFPFVVSVHAFITCRHLLYHRVEIPLLRAEHACRTPGCGGDRVKIMGDNSARSFLERVLLAISTTLDSIESLNQYLEDMANELRPSAKSEKVLQSTNNILSAVNFQRKAINDLREGVRFAERRARNEASFRAVELSSLDSNINIKTAVASRGLAAAARQDSSAMKSIAVLTMAFLPGTFFAALFSMPSLGWDQPRHFILYWAYTIPFTIVTFIIWGIFTQRNNLRRWAKENWVFLSLLPMWYLMPEKKKQDDLDEELKFAVEYSYEECVKRWELVKRQQEAQERLRDRINRWKPW